MKIFEITEGPTPQALELIEKNCSQYLAEVGGIKKALYIHPLYRGIDHQIPKDAPIERISVRQDRKPRSSSILMHQTADEWLATNMPSGTHYRSSSLFVTGESEAASKYGTVAIVIPIGDYDYCYSTHVRDLYLTLRDKAPTATAEGYLSVMRSVQYIENKYLISGIETGVEIMLHCKEAFLIRSGEPQSTPSFL